MSKAVLNVLACITICAAAPLGAQVGHDPARSPFRDITNRQQLTVFAGHFGGARTQPGVGARPGTMWGIKFESRLSGPLDLALSLSRIASTRWVVDPLVPPPRTSGPVDYTLNAADAAVSLNLTGSKSWHGLGPYMGLGFGLVAPTRGRTDNGGYRAGSNFGLVPFIGTRVHVTRTLAVRVEARDHYFRYEWPLAYFNPLDANQNPVANPVLGVDDSDTQWTHNFAIAIGLTFAFNF